MVLKANDRCTSCPCHDEFRGPRSDYVRQVELATTTTTDCGSQFCGRNRGVICVKINHCERCVMGCH
ncbi:hypothetical protein TNCV_3356711 [Trichonephila clavipes]|nr:hypothetical protein TNCV_3356711 [Trichonephila clavipes]